MNSKIKKGLGRGLSSLIGETKVETKTNKLSLVDIVPNKFQPRKDFDEDILKDLTNSIKERGVIQPIIVRKSAIENSKFEIIAGERRWLAARKAGLHEIPVRVLDLSENSLANKSAKVIQFLMIQSLSLSELFLRWNWFSKHEMETLSEGLFSNKNLITIDFAFNSLGKCKSNDQNSMKKEKDIYSNHNNISNIDDFYTYLKNQISKFGGNVSKTASYVGMERSALHRKLKLLGVKDLN